MSKIIFWDFDGTLSYTGSIWAIVIHSTLNEYTDKADFNEVRMHLRSGHTWQSPELSYTETGMLWWDKLLLHIAKLYSRYGIPQDKFAELNAKIHRQMILPDTYKLYDDAADTLRECARLGMKNYILSNNYPELPHVIKALGLDPYLSGYIVSAQIGFEKPHPGIFDHALALANVNRASDNYFMVGDNPIADMKGGKDAGFQTIYVHAAENRKICEYADYVASSLSKIPAIIEAKNVTPS